jgi:hypothetical protein
MVSGQNKVEVFSPSGRRFVIDCSDSGAVAVYNDAGRRMLRVTLKGISQQAMIRRIRENIETGAPAYLAAWPPKDVDRILTSHAIACER